MDPPELREELQGMAKKKVDLVSPQLPEEEGDKGSKSPASSDNNDNKAKDKRGRRPETQRGLQIVAFDQDKDLVTVTSTMDAKALVESLRERVSSPVEVVHPKKDKDGGSGSGGRKNKKGGGNGSKEEGDGGGGGGKDGGKGDVRRSRRVLMEYNGIPPGYGYNSGFMYRNSLHAPQMFIDENPNALT